MKNDLQTTNTAVIVAAGSGKRMGGELPKQFLPLGGEPILARTIRPFADSPYIDEIVLVVGNDPVQGEEQHSYVQKQIVEAYGFSNVREIVAGGETRPESVYQGLCHCRGKGLVFIQDAVRPFVTEEIIARGWEVAQRCGNAVCGMPAKDTVKITDSEGCVRDTPDRDGVWIVQTPQIFALEEIRQAYEQCREAGQGWEAMTDDAMVLEHSGGTVHMFPGAYTNLKITTPEDLRMAEALL